MPEFKTKEEYEKWKAERLKDAQEKQSKPQPEVKPIVAEKKIKMKATKKPHIKKEGSFAGTGCLIQAIGILLFLGSFLAFPVGPFFGFPLMIILFIWGSSKAGKLLCSECGNPIDNKKVKLCPSCKVAFS
ncbi:MAG: hypothetical protein WC769_01620 [Thermodesulfovibrionales bacterium]|jgi:hypothetical protein